MGLLMAFTNSEGPPLAPGSLFTRGLMWLSLAIVAFTITAAVDYRWFRQFVWPIYLLNIGLLVLTLAVGSGAGGASWATIGPLQFQFGGGQDDGHRARRLGRLTAREGEPAVDPGGRGGGGRPAAGADPHRARPGHLAGHRRHRLWHLVRGRRQPALDASSIVALVAAFPIIWSRSSRTTRSSASRRSWTRSFTRRGPGFQLLQSQIAVSTGGLTGKGLTGGGAEGVDYLPVSSTDFVFARLGEELGFARRHRDAGAVRAAAMARDARRLAEPRPVRGWRSRVASERCCCSSCWSTWGWCWASCPSRASRCRS